MKILENKQVVTVALMLFLAASAIFISLPTADAQNRTYKTNSQITVNPTPIGVGQTAFASFWLDRFPPSFNNLYPLTVWDFKVTITKPDGTTETKQMKSDAIGGAQFSYVPTAIGTYTFVMQFLGGVNPANNDTYAPSTSNTWSLVAQQAPINYWPAAPLPTEYWKRPIEAQNREWNTIAGNWLGMFPLGNPGNINAYDTYGKFNPYTTGPKTAHIMWTKPVYDSNFGGLVGGANDYGIYSGDSYELKFAGFIMLGVYYHNIPKVNQASGGGFQAIDLRTGKELWRSPNGTESIGFGQLLQFDSLNQHGVIPYLWTTNLNCYDPNNGQWLFSFANVTSGSIFQDEKGNILSYVLNHNQKTMTLWNSTQAIQLGRPAPFVGFGSTPDYWRPAYGYSNVSWPAGIMWNKTITGDFADSGGILKISVADRVILTRGTLGANATFPDGVEVVAGYSMDDGQLLWHKYRTGEEAVLGQQSVFGYNVVPGAFVVQRQENRVVKCFDIKTGNLMWTSEPKENPWGSYFTTIGDSSIQGAYGNVYITGYDGTMYCYKVATGELLWKTFVGSSGFETPYGTWPLWGSLAIADGKVYAGTNEHSINQPMYRGEKLYCFDANTGDIIWSVYGIDMNPMIADGYLLTLNSYDMQIYVFGKGISATTVEGPLTALPLGSSMVIQGTVTDQGPGQTSLGIPAAGTPAISDVSMSSWMEYLYMEKPKPTNATGVPVTLVAIAADGSSETIGMVISDVSGTFATSWTPKAQGLYTIVANFDGTDSYYKSWAETHVVVGAAPATVNVPSANDVASAVVSQIPTAAPFPTVPSASDVASQVVSKIPSTDNTMMTVVVVAVVVAILIGIVNLVMLLRKKL